jgi:hypothetical protein
MANGILLAAFDFTNAQEDEFHDWYDLEHLPERQQIPGFGLCERWISVTHPRQAVATYDLTSHDVLESAPYRVISHRNLSPWSKRVIPMCHRLIRFDGEQTLPGNGDSPRGAGGLLVNAMNVAAEHESEFNEWYDNEHIPALAAVPGVLSARRFRDPNGTHRYLALYHLATPEVTFRQDWKSAASTPWTERLRPHFRDHVRIPARRYIREF